MKNKKSRISLPDKQVGRLFDGRVDDYMDFVRSTVPRYDEISKIMGDLIKIYLSKTDYPRVLDLGTGTGNTSLIVLEEFPKTHLVGYDISKEMVSKANQRLKNFNAQVIRGDVSDINYRKEFDMIISAIVYHHIEGAKKEKAYKKVYDALKQEGIFILADIMNHNDPRLDNWVQAEYSRFIEKKKGPAYRDKILKGSEHHHKPSTLNENLEYLQNVGFRTEVYWKYLNSAVICCFK